jgi:hypothetical protein
LLAAPPTVTVTLPVVAPLGTTATILVADHEVVVAVTPLNVTVLEPLVDPKFAPVIETDVPTAPLAGDNEVMLGVVGGGDAVVTVKVLPLLTTPPTVTVTLPVVAPLGTAAAMLVADQDEAVAVTPLNLTTLVPWVAPKFVPVMVTAVPTTPLGGDSDVIVGDNAVTVNVLPLLTRPPTVTVTLPVVAPLGTAAAMLVADHDDGAAATPLNLTTLVPWVAPKFVPVIVTVVPTGPVGGDNDAIVGGVVTVNVTPLLATPPTVTVTLPVVAALGTAAATLVADHDVVAAVTPLNFTELVPFVAPKFVPVIVTVVPVGPLVGDSDAIVAVGTTVNDTPLLATPPTVTVTVPVVAPLGTDAVMLVADHDDVVAVTPLNFTVLVPFVAPKFAPAIVTDAPTAPLVGDNELTVGVAVIVNVTPLLATPPTVTVTLPVVAPLGTAAAMAVADHDEVVAVTPLNFTTLVPWVAPKFVPVIVTVVPTAPLVGDKELIVGVPATATVKVTPLLATPPTVTTTFPVDAPLGTATVMLVSLQAVGEPLTPLNETVLVLCVAPKPVPAITTGVPTNPVAGVRLEMEGPLTR